MEASSRTSTMLGEVMVRILRHRVLQTSGGDLNAQRIDTMIDTISRVNPSQSIISMLNEYQHIGESPATRELARLLSLEDPTGTPWGAFGETAIEDHLAIAVGMVARLNAARYGIDETVEREALRVTMQDNPIMRRETLLLALDIIGMLITLQDQHDSTGE